MIEERVLNNIYANYDAFYAMTLASAMVSSYNSEQFESDAGKIIGFIGEAYELDCGFVKDFKACIFGDMMYIGLLSDYLAFGSAENENRSVLELKGRVLEEVSQINSRAYFYSNSRINQNIKANMKYEAFHHEYEPHIRLSMVKQQAAYGEVISTRQLAMLYALGIGCERMPEKAGVHLIRCVYWGDTVSAKLLALLYKKEGEIEKSITFSEVAQYMEATDDDSLIRLDEIKMSEEVRSICYCAAYIRKMIVIPGKYNEIDTVFVDVIAREDIPLETKLLYILRYKEMLWKNDSIQYGCKKRIGY